MSYSFASMRDRRKQMSAEDFRATFFTPKSPIQRNSIEQCTRCGRRKLIDITHHEFPKQTGLVFECMSCGNNSLRSNVNDDERQRRLACIADNHLNVRECQVCLKRFQAEQDYFLHLQTDHQSKTAK